MADWTLANIISKVRHVTGRYTSDEMTQNEVIQYINRYYQYTFPAEVKLDRNYTYAEFVTTPNVHIYDPPAGFTNFVPPATIDRLSLEWYQSPPAFSRNNPEQIFKITAFTGDGATVTFSTTLSQVPILPNTLIVSDNTEYFQDTNTNFNATQPVTLTGSAGGTGSINYSTGALSVTFNTAPASGQSIYVSYVQFVAGRPTAVLWFNNKFQFYNVPDQVYRFRVQAYSDVLVLKSDGTTAALFADLTDEPLLDQWGPAIAYGAARQIFSDYGELDAYQETTALYKEQLGYILRRTHQNLLNTRAAPNF